jgi:hypothetical protein
MNNGRFPRIFPELSSQLRISRMLESITNFLILSRTQQVRYASAAETNRQGEMNGKVREELAVNCSKYNERIAYKHETSSGNCN